MDCNSIIYDAVRSMDASNNIVDFENQLIQAVIVKIIYYIEMISPSETAYIAFDGVAPFAKMDQQRNRRYKSVMLSKIAECVHPTATSNDSRTSWSTSNITPGTYFMQKLSEEVSIQLKKYSDKHLNIKKLIVSTSNEPGEGEHKMFHYMRDYFSDCKTKASKDCVAVYGLDSDLIMLSVFHYKLVNNIFIFRETPEFASSIVGITPSDSKNECSFMDISRLSWGILHELQCNGVNGHRIYDYVFLCFFLGNDFLPHFPALNIRTSGMDTLLGVYRRIIGTYPNRYFISSESLEIQWNWVLLFVKELSRYEHDLILTEYDARKKWSKKMWPTKTAEERDFFVQSVPVIYRSEEMYICPSEKYWQKRYYDSLFGEGSDTYAICMNYMEGLEWVFHYYTKDCPHWRWSYQYKYPPLLCDLAQVMSKKTPKIDSLSKNNKPFSSSVQLAYVLPKMQHHLLSSKVSTILHQKCYSHYFPDSVQFTWAFCRYFWEAHADLPEISLNVLQEWSELFDKIDKETLSG
jgi:5'-3' exonuclease